MKKKKKSVLRCILFGLIFSTMLFLISAGKWLRKEWDRIDFATVIYQLSTPLKGTNIEIIENFCRSTLIPTITGGLVFTMCCYLFERVFPVMYFQFDIKMFSKRVLLKTSKKFYTVGKKIFLCTSFCILGIGLLVKIKELGIDKYILEISQSSNIFEEYYIDPSDTSLVFPEKKRNLIFIYMESMESTYASVEAGGGKPDNYIPELTALAEENISISNGGKIGGIRPCPLTGWTIGALLGSTSGVPYKIPGDGNSSERYSEFLPGITTLGDILQDEGYENYFLCGSDAEFAGRDVYFQKHGNYQIHDYYWAAQNGFIPEGYSTAWGFEDVYLFDIAKQDLDRIAASGKNFNYTMLTVDTHQADICEL